MSAGPFSDQEVFQDWMFEKLGLEGETNDLDIYGWHEVLGEPHGRPLAASTPAEAKRVLLAKLNYYRQNYNDTYKKLLSCNKNKLRPDDCKKAGCSYESYPVKSSGGRVVQYPACRIARQERDKLYDSYLQSLVNKMERSGYDDRYHN